MWTTIIILSLATVQRIIEFSIAQRNTSRMVDRGGVTVGPNLQWVQIILQALWLTALWYFAYALEADWTWLFAYLALEAIRGWVVAAMGSRWTSRIVVVPGEKFEDVRPFNTFREPNFIIIGMEMFILPMAFGLWWLGLAFVAAYAGVVYWRVTRENAALRPLYEPQPPVSP